MPARDKIRVSPADFASLGEKLQRMRKTLSAGEANVFEYLMESAGAAAGQWPPPSWFRLRFKYKPRGAKMLVAGGADGLTILINSHGKITVVPPEGPLPTDRTGAGAIPING